VEKPDLYMRTNRNLIVVCSSLLWLPDDVEHEFGVAWYDSFAQITTTV